MGPIKFARRITYIDIARGIGILLVVLAHNDLAAVSPFLRKFIYSFHVPLFFFLSGFFFNVDVPLWDFLRKRFNSLLKPYLVVIALIYLTSVSFTGMRFETAVGRVIKSLYASGNYIPWVQLWFLPNLFAASILAYLFYRLGGGTFRQAVVRWTALLLTLVIAVPVLQAFFPFRLSLLGNTYELYGLPFSLDLVLVSGFYFILGNETRQLTSEQTFERPALPILAGLALVLLVVFFEGEVDLNLRVYEAPVINTLEAIFGIVLVLALSRQIELRTTWLAALLKYAGKISIFILIFHVPVQEFWAEKLRAATGNEFIFFTGGFIASVLISTLIYELFIGSNPMALRLFGRPVPAPTFQKEVISPQEVGGE